MLICIIKYFFLVLLVVLYLATTTTHLIAFLKPHPFVLRMKRPLLFITGVFHLLEFITLFLLEGLMPIHSLQDITSAMALMMLSCYFILELVAPLEIKDSGGFVAFVATVLQVSSSLLPREPLVIATPNPVVDLHIISIIFGYSGIFISGVYSFLYLVLFYSIRQNYFGIFFERMSSLETMQKMSSGSAAVGFVFLSLAFVFGIIISIDSPSFSFSDPKLVSLIAVWSIYGLSIFLKHQLQLQGEKLAIVFIACFGFAFALFVVLNFLTSQFHRGG